MITAEPQFQQVFNVLRRHSLPILLLSFIGTAVAGFGGLLIPPRYTAKSEIVIEPQQPAAVSGQAVVVAPQDPTVVQTQIAALTSRDHLRHVLASLTQDPAFQAASAPVGNSGTGLGGLSATIRAWVDAQWRAYGAPALQAALSLVDMGRNQAAHADREKPGGEAALDQFESHLLIVQERGSQAVAANFTSTSPAQAALAANRVVQLFADGQFEQKRENTNRTLEWIGARIAELRAELERKDAALERYRIDHAFPGSNQTDVVDTRLAELNRELTAAQADLAGRRARMDYVSDLRRRSPGALIGNVDSPVIAELRHEELGLRNAAAGLKPTFGESHPNSQLHEVQQRIADELGRSVDNLRDDVKIATARVGSIQEQLAAVQSAGNKRQEAEAHLREMEHQTAATRQLYESLSQRREQLREQQEMISPDVRILSLAAPPDRPSSPNPIFLMLPAFIVCWLGGSLVAIGAERMSRGLRSARDVTEVLGIRCIGLVPRLRSTRRVRPHQQLLSKRFGTYTEAIRSLVATLQFGSSRPAPKVVLVTSSVPREGKTTLAVSFAAYAALVGRRVILVDLDFRHPAVLREIRGKDISDAPESDYPDDLCAAAIQTVPALGLDLLPLRRPPDDPLTPFANGQLPRLIRSLRDQYDLVVIDGPPLLAVIEARLLTALADRILFAVQWGTTRQDVALNALNLLRDPRLLGDELVSETIAAVVTQVDLRRHAKYRFGDAGESLMRFKQYYLEGHDSAFRKLAFVPGANALRRSAGAQDPGAGPPLDEMGE